jgi:hypothetical protein
LSGCAGGYATPLADYTIRQVCSGRCVGTKLNLRNVSSRHAQCTNGITVERLDKFAALKGEWREALVEDRKAGPAGTAAARISVMLLFADVPMLITAAPPTARGSNPFTFRFAFGVSRGRMALAFSED